MENNHETRWSKFWKKIRDQFITGILLLAPVVLTVWILAWIFTTVDNILQPILVLTGFSFPGLGFAITIILIYVVGVIAGSIDGRRFIRYGQYLLSKVPVFRPIYSTIKQITESFSGAGQTAFTQVVLVEFPRKGMRTVGFITNEVVCKNEEKLVSIYIPTSPNPTSGFFQIVNDKDIIRTNIPVSEAMRSIISAGKVPLQQITKDWPFDS
jgi:uncharacterized membrane protein